MKSLFVSPFYESAWARALVAQGVEVEVLTTTANARREFDVTPNVPLDRNGVKVTYFPRRRWCGNRFVSLPLARACVRRIADFDVIYAVALHQCARLFSGAADGAAI